MCRRQIDPLPAGRLYQVQAPSGAHYYDVRVEDVEQVVWSLLHPELPGIEVVAKASCVSCQGFGCSGCGRTGVVHGGRAA